MKVFLNEKNAEKELHVSSYIILYKLCYGILEFVSGVVVAFFGRQMLRTYNLDITRELSEDPHDLFARIAHIILPNLIVHRTSLVITLILLGAAKIAGAIGLLYKQNWGVDLLVGLTMVMFPFQLVNLIMHPSFFDFLYITIGLIIAMYLIEFKPKAWVSRLLQTRF